MGSAPENLPCDGCGLPASPEHIAERLQRLELSTRFRPVHIGVLFVVLAPAPRPADDFYGPPESKQFFDPFLEALEISGATGKLGMESGALMADTARLMEFQHKGHYLAYVSECAIPANQEPAASTIARLAPTFLRRIRFNYKPKMIAPLGPELLPLANLLKAEQAGPVLTLDHGQPLPLPRTGDRDWPKLFERAEATAAPHEYLSPGYDRIPLTSTERDCGAGGNT